ncbi:MAG: hypothetical protein AB1726_08570 [Planctomycetota bacterium]
MSTRARARILPALAALALFAARPAAHHILGIPHYAYDEAYPQAPVITYSVAAGPYVVEVTGYPGRPRPGERAEVRAYVHRAADASDVFAGPISARIEKDALLGPEVAWGPAPTRFDENLHKISPTFAEEGTYRIRLEMELEGQPYEIDFPIAVGDPGSPTAALLGWGAGIVMLLVAVRAARIKIGRARARAA